MLELEDSCRSSQMQGQFRGGEELRWYALGGFGIGLETWYGE
jgi:hypothetical protein